MRGEDNTPGFGKQFTEIKTGQLWLLIRDFEDVFIDEPGKAQWVKQNSDASGVYSAGALEVAVETSVWASQTSWNRWLRVF